MLEVVTLLLGTRDPWRWSSMSCHLDCFLMVELAFFHHLAKSNSLQDGLVLASPPLQRLFKVLLAVGTPKQGLLRDAYWAMEIETYGKPVTYAARCRFGCSMDYDYHRDVLYAMHTSSGGVPLCTLKSTAHVSCTGTLHPGGDRIKTNSRISIQTPSRLNSHGTRMVLDSAGLEFLGTDQRQRQPVEHGQSSDAQTHGPGG